MALINRIGRLFTADLHAVLDRIEEPEVLLAQAIREMGEELTKSERRLASLERDGARLGDRAERAREAIEKFAQELEVCLESGEDALARTIIRRKLTEERRADNLARDAERVAAGAAELRSVIESQTNELELMRQKSEVLVDDDPVRGFDAMPDLAVTDEDVEVAFLKARQARS